MTKVLNIVHRVISCDYIKRAGLRVKSGAQTGAVTLLQRFGWYGIPGALNLNFQLHMRYIDGAFNQRAVSYPVKPPTKQDLDIVTHKIAQRVARYLEQAGYLVRDAESDYLDLQTDDDDAMATLIGASSETALVRHSGRSYRLAFGPNAGLGAPAETNDLADHAVNYERIKSWRTGLRGPVANRPASPCMLTSPAKPRREKSWSGSVATSRDRQFQNNGSHWPAMGKLSISSRPLTTMGRPMSYLGGPTSPLEFIGRLAALVPGPRVK